MTVDDIRQVIRKEGFGVYGGTKEYHIYICAGDTLYGTGDYEDEPQTANDKNVRCYTVYISDMLEPGRINASAGQYESFEEAVREAEKTAGFAGWKDCGDKQSFLHLRNLCS